MALALGVTNPRRGVGVELAALESPGERLSERSKDVVTGAGAKGDTPYDAIQTLAYKDPKAYYMATVSALPGVTLAAVANAKKGIDAAIASGNYTAKDITAATDALWQTTGVWHTLGLVALDDRAQTHVALIRSRR
jgi:hypothetical protein